MHPHVLIAGGGIGGLAAALALLRLGIDVDVYEQARELREVGAGVQISANGNHTLYALGLQAAMEALAVETQGKEIRLWNTGQTWKLFDLGPVSVERYGYPYCTVWRPDLLAVLADAVRRLKPNAIHLGVQCAGFTQANGRVTLRLADGGAPAGDLLIGADGVHSTIRSQLFGAGKARFTGFAAWRGVIPMERLPAHLRRPIGTNWVGPGSHVVHYPLRSGVLMNFVGFVERPDWQVESWMMRGDPADLLRDYAGWHGDVVTMIRAIDEPFQWALASRPPLERWGVGHVTLLGDACHPTLPMLAQGAVMALEDGFILARCLSASATIEVALQRYEQARIERTTRIVIGSAENGERFHNKKLGDAAEAARFVETEWAKQRVDDRYDWLFRYDVTTAPI
ncbi:MAG: monooxygenase [Betaproteobacteria bacterium]|nr:monooxygenase [Betaproteobacteria bacterium]